MRRLGLLVCLLLALIGPVPAVLADGDPASDVLLNADAFYPYQPLVSLSFTKALTQEIKAAHAAGFPIKVALIASANDLGAIPELFGKPQKYSDFLDREISFNKQATLLVVMPQGFGVTAAGSARALAALRIVPVAGSSDGLARAGIQAVAALSAQAGHPLPPPKLPSPSAGGSGGGGTSPLLSFGAPVIVVLLGALAARFIRSRQESEE